MNPVSVWTAVAYWPRSRWLYETYGTLNEQKTNAILVEHAWTGDAHLAGKRSDSETKPGWWDAIVGPGRLLDTDRYFVICSNVIGSCFGSTGPASINPKTGKRYNLSFPVVTDSRHGSRPEAADRCARD